MYGSPDESVQVIFGQRLSFAMAGNPDAGSQTVSMEVWWGSNLVDTPSFDTTGHSRSNMGWVYRQYTVVATDNVTRLRFESLTENCCFGPTLDDVSVGGVVTAYSISGRVTDGGNNPIAGVAISNGAGHAATTDSNGNYTLSGLAAGTYTITPSKSGYNFAPPSRTVTVPPDATGQDFIGAQGCYGQSSAVEIPTGFNPSSPFGYIFTPVAADRTPIPPGVQLVPPSPDLIEELLKAGYSQVMIVDLLKEPVGVDTPQSL